MPGMTFDDIQHIFKYHAPTPDQLPKYEIIRDTARTLALTIIEYTPQCPSQTTAIQLLRQAVMVANQAIATGL